MHTRFIELAGEINTSMPSYVLEKIVSALNNSGKALKGSKILVLGISYKKNVDDVRESPSVEIIDMAINKGAIVNYSDPFFPSFPKMRKYKYSLENLKLNHDNLNSQDLVLLATDHDNFDYELIRKSSKIIIDTRGRFSSSSKIIRA